MSTYTMSIETEPGLVIRHGFYLGTYEHIARHFIEEKFRIRVIQRKPTITIALMRAGRVVDVFYGDRWQSDYRMSA